VNPLVRLLGELDRRGLMLTSDGPDLIVEPGSRLTPELETEILGLKPELLELARVHGPRLVGPFREAPTWPPARGRSGPVPPGLWSAVGHPVRLRDGREGRLRFAEYDTRSGRVRCRVDFAAGSDLIDPDDLSSLSVGIELLPSA
jgi:hypothetical protein